MVVQPRVDHVWDVTTQSSVQMLSARPVEASPIPQQKAWLGGSSRRTDQASGSKRQLKIDALWRKFPSSDATKQEVSDGQDELDHLVARQPRALKHQARSSSAVALVERHVSEGSDQITPARVVQRQSGGRTRQLKIDDSWNNVSPPPGVQHQPQHDGRAPEYVRVPDGLEPLNWPNGHVRFVTQFINDSSIVFEPMSPFGTCDCDALCRFQTCTNARAHVLCGENCCAFGGRCGNNVPTWVPLQLIQNDSTFGFGVYATAPIEKGVIIGEYIGEPMTLTASETSKKRGYLMEMKATARQFKTKVYIDASKCGNLTRFLNHSCRAACRFEELCNGPRHTIVIVTVRNIDPGEQVTVDYEGRLWFECQCGEANCSSLH